MAKISIIIPVYNAEKYLRKCLESVINQTFKDIEILCINDGSTDSSLNILNEYAEKDERVRVFSQKNSGPAVARNVGLAEAGGEYLWFIDADDWMELNACEILCSLFVFNKFDVIAFASNVFDVRDGNLVTDESRSLDKLPKNIFNNVFKLVDYPNIFNYLPTEAWNKVFNKNFLIHNNISFSSKIFGMDDGLLTQECFLKANSLYIIKEKLYNYRIFNPSSIVSSLVNVNLKNYMTTINYSKESLKLIEDLNPSCAVISSLVSRNINRMLKYLDWSKGFVRVCYYFKLKKHLKEIIKRYPFIQESLDSSYTLNSLFDGSYKLIKHNLSEMFFKKVKHCETQNFYKINKVKYYILGVLVFRKTTKEINLECFQNSLLTKMQRIINIALLHQKTFGEFKNCNQNKIVTLIGAGPTVNFYTPIENSVFVGCNRAILYEKVNFDYVFALDKIGLEATSKFLLDYKNKNCVKFIGDINCGKDYQIPEDFILKTQARTYKTTCGVSRDSFTLDIDREPIGAFHSVAFQAIQFILFTNPSKIYIVGIDCASSGAHFAGAEHYVSSRGEDIELLQQEQIREWKLLKDFVEIYYPKVGYGTFNQKQRECKNTWKRTFTNSV